MKNQSKKEPSVNRAPIGVYVLLSAFWILFVPLTVLIVSPEVFKFLGELGRYSSEDLHREYVLLASCACALLLANGVFLVWHYWFKRYKGYVFKNKYYCCLTVVSNFALACEFLSYVFTPAIN